MINKRGNEVITGYHELGNVTKAALIESGGHMVNKRGKEVITAFHDLGNLGGAANIKIVRPKRWMSIIHISVSLHCAGGVCQSSIYRDTLYMRTIAMTHSYQEWKDKSRDRRRG